MPETSWGKKNCKIHPHCILKSQQGRFFSTVRQIWRKVILQAIQCLLKGEFWYPIPLPATCKTFESKRELKSVTVSTYAPPPSALQHESHSATLSHVLQRWEDEDMFERVLLKGNMEGRRVLYHWRCCPQRHLSLQQVSNIRERNCHVCTIHMGTSCLPYVAHKLFWRCL